MDYSRILTRSFEITLKHRALWLFGILLALFSGVGSGNFGNFGNLGNLGSGNGAGRTGGLPSLPPGFWQMVAIIVLALLCLFLCLFLLSIILRFVSRGALIGLVQELEANATVPTVRRGFSIGGGRFWQLLGIGLTINLPLSILSIALLLLAALPAIASIVPMIEAGRSPQQIGGMLVGAILSSVALLCCVGIFLWLVGLVIRPFYEFFQRECVLQKRGVFDSIREGYRLVRTNVGNIAVLYVLIIGIQIGFGFVMLLGGLILSAIALAAGVVAGYAAQSIGPGILVGVIVGIPVLLVLLFVSGLFQALESTLWTEGYLATIAPKTPGVAG
jgi:hypothetical protein